MEANAATEYEVMHGAPSVKNASTISDTHPFDMKSHSTEETDSEMHIYAHIGENLKEHKEN